MSAKHALLGLLLQKPAYRYQLGDRLQKRLGPAWRINSGQLYQTIRTLERDGLIERVDALAHGEDGLDVFATTAAGAEAFERWFEQETSSTPLLRRPLLVKITLAGPERLQSAIGQVERYAQQCTARLKELSHEQDAIPPAGLQVRADHELLRYALSGEVACVEAELRWARYMQERLCWLKNQDVIWPTTPRRPPTERARARRDARTELFERIADRPLRAPRRRKGQNDDDG